MTNVDKNLSDILDVDYVPVEQPSQQVVLRQEDQLVEKTIDADFSRSNYYNLIEKGNEAIDGILNVARESQHPRAYEVAATLIKNMSDVTEKLMQLQIQKKALETEQQSQTNVTVEKAVFVGSTADLLNRIKNGSSSE
jgi:Terminase DNA packaging enzyme